MQSKGRRLGIWLVGWLITPQMAGAAVIAAIGSVLAILDNRPATIVFLFALVGLIAGLLVAHLGLWLYERWRDRKPAAGSPSDRCGDPRDRLRELRRSAKWLAHDLENFETWRRAVEDESFDGRIGGRPTTHKEAMQRLQFIFARFFSLAWAYECDCPGHRHHDEVIEWVIGVYGALGDNPSPPPDHSLMSHQLHAIGERSTKDWGTSKAQPMGEAAFGAAIEDDPHFAGAFMQLRRLLLAGAQPNSKPRARLEAVARSARHVEERLNAKGYH
jgi:hypothetical protein